MTSPAEVPREAFLERLAGATLAFHDVLTLYLGERLGLYEALARRGPATSAELAERTGTSERYVREWLAQQAAAGILDVEDDDGPPEARRFRLPAGPAEVLTERESLAFQAARPRSLVALVRHLPALLEAFRSGSGVPEAGRDDDARAAQGELSRMPFLTFLGTDWIPRVPDVHARLVGLPPARVADVACGSGWSSVALARSYPRARVDGFDLDAAVVEEARRNARDAGVAGRVAFHGKDAADPGLPEGYDLVLCFEALHDLPRPVEALAAMRRLAGPKGAVIVVDEKVGDAFRLPAPPNDRLNYGWSVLTCLPAGMCGTDPAGTGAVMRPSLLARYAAEAGFAAVDVLDVPHDGWLFYRLLPEDGAR